MKTILILFIVLSVVLVGCSETNNSEILPDTHRASFRSVCDVGKKIGMWAFSTSAYKQGYGFAVRMTDAEYEIECTQYE